jgi:predicted phosphoribosyltransferase
MVLFEDRRHAGEVLARRLRDYTGRPDVVVLALPRGGVPVGFEIARELGAPLDVFLVRKLGVPGQEELAMGAIASGGVQVLNPDVLSSLYISPEVIERVAEREGEELARRERAYRGDRPALPLQGRVALLVDDGLATGTTMKAAVAGLVQHGPARIVVAVPVASERACRELGDEVDELVVVITPEPFFSVGQWYETFDQTSDEEVRALLRQARGSEAGEPAAPA